MHKEISAGGVVEKRGKLLLVKVKNLQGEIVWTFPKGHLEAQETYSQAALREVLEETGYDCTIEALLMTTRYRFMRHGRPVDKQVRWYWMNPRKRSGRMDEDEILDVRWVSIAAAPKWLRYLSDFQLLEKFQKKMERSCAGHALAERPSRSRKARGAKGSGLGKRAA